MEPIRRDVRNLRSKRKFTGAMALSLAMGASLALALVLMLRSLNDQRQLSLLIQENRELSGHIKDQDAQIRRLKDFNKEKMAELYDQQKAVTEKSSKNNGVSSKRDDEKLIKLEQSLRKGLAEVMSKKNLFIKRGSGEILVRLPDDVLFDSGRADLKSEGRDILLKITDILNTEKIETMVRVEGHTDTTPIGSRLKRKFPSNWDLSAARATATVRYLNEEGEILPMRLVAVGKGSTELLNKENPEAAENRRVELILSLKEPQK